MRQFLILMVFLIFCSVCFAETITDGAGTIGAAPSTGTTTVAASVAPDAKTVTYGGHRVTVQRVPNLRELDGWEVRAIDAWRIYLTPRIGSLEATGKASRLTFLTRWSIMDGYGRPSPAYRRGVTHIVVTKKDANGQPVEGKVISTTDAVDNDYQVAMAVLNATDWYVNLPAFKIEVPSRQPAPYVPPLKDFTLPSVSDGVFLQPPTPRPAVVVSSRGGGPIGTYQFGKGPEVNQYEVPVAQHWRSTTRLPIIVTDEGEICIPLPPWLDDGGGDAIDPPPWMAD